MVNVGLDDGFLVLDDDGDLGDLDDLVNSLQNTQKFEYLMIIGTDIHSASLSMAKCVKFGL